MKNNDFFCLWLGLYIDTGSSFGLGGFVLIVALAAGMTLWMFACCCRIHWSNATQAFVLSNPRGTHQCIGCLTTVALRPLRVDLRPIPDTVCLLLFWAPPFRIHHVLRRFWLAWDTFNTYSIELHHQEWLGNVAISQFSSYYMTEIFPVGKGGLLYITF